MLARHAAVCLAVGLGLGLVCGAAAEDLPSWIPVLATLLLSVFAGTLLGRHYVRLYTQPPDPKE